MTDDEMDVSFGLRSRTLLASSSGCATGRRPPAGGARLGIF